MLGELAVPDVEHIDAVPADASTIAFGLGLADPSGTIDRAVPTDDQVPELPEPA